jgi:hypothetical protein
MPSCNPSHSSRGPLGRPTGPQLDPRGFISVDPTRWVARKKLTDSMVGVTGFEPATPTSRRCRSNLAGQRTGRSVPCCGAATYDCVESSSCAHGRRRPADSLRHRDPAGSHLPGEERLPAFDRQLFVGAIMRRSAQYGGRHSHAVIVEAN